MAAPISIALHALTKDPAIDDEATFVEISDRGLPLVTLVQVPAFDDAAAGKTQESWLHVFQELHEIGAQAVRLLILALS